MKVLRNVIAKNLKNKEVESQGNSSELVNRSEPQNAKIRKEPPTSSSPTAKRAKAVADTHFDSIKHLSCDEYCELTSITFERLFARESDKNLREEIFTLIQSGCCSPFPTESLSCASKLEFSNDGDDIRLFERVRAMSNALIEVILGIYQLSGRGSMAQNKLQAWDVMTKSVVWKGLNPMRTLDNLPEFQLRPLTLAECRSVQRGLYSIWKPSTIESHTTNRSKLSHILKGGDKLGDTNEALTYLLRLAIPAVRYTLFSMLASRIYFSTVNLEESDQEFTIEDILYLYYVFLVVKDSEFHLVKDLEAIQSGGKRPLDKSMSPALANKLAELAREVHPSLTTVILNLD